MIASELFSVLSSQSTITALAGTRIYPVTIPHDPTLPAISYSIVSSVTDPTFNNAGQRKYRIQIDCWDSSYASVDRLRDAVIQTLDGYADTTILDCWLAMQTDFFEHDLLQYRAMVEFYILSNS